MGERVKNDSKWRKIMSVALHISESKHPSVVVSIWCKQSHTHFSIPSTNLMCVKNITCHFCLWHLLSGTLEQRQKKEQLIILIVDHFSLTFVNPLLAWMLYFHVWLQNKAKVLVWRKYYNQFGIHQPSCVSLLQLRQSTLSNPRAYSASCQTSKMEC